MEAARICRTTTEFSPMATPTDTHAEPVNNETPSQGIFMGYLALVLMDRCDRRRGVLAIFAGANGVR